MSYETLIVEKKGGIAKITLNRPQVMNALNEKLCYELMEALEEAQKDETVRVVVLRGAGRAFCAGADLKEYPLGGGRAKDLGFCGLWETIENLEKPVIAAVHGYAITGGFMLAYCSDIVIATEDAQFADTHARWGLIPTGGETQRLPRKVGIFKAKELMLTSDFISAQEAERLGIVSKVVPADKLDEAVEELAQKLLRNSSRSMAFIKTLINRGMEVDFATGLKLEALANRWGKANAEPDPDREERLKAFREKKGR
jgi:enoyl-CoA hydratase/carnithine racemase